MIFQWPRKQINCRNPGLRQIFALRDTDKSQYFAISEFNNCFIIQSPSFFYILITSWQHRKNVVPVTREENVICSRFRRYYKVIYRLRFGLSAYAKGKNASNNSLCYGTCRMMFIKMTVKSKFLLVRLKMAAQLVKIH